MIQSHLVGTLADRLCQLGIAALEALDVEAFPPDAVLAIRDAARDLELGLASGAELRKAPALAIDCIEGRWVAAICRLRKESHGHECQILEAAPAGVKDSDVLTLSGRWALAADIEDREAGL